MSVTFIASNIRNKQRTANKDISGWLRGLLTGITCIVHLHNYGCGKFHVDSKKNVLVNSASQVLQWSSVNTDTDNTNMLDDFLIPRTSFLLTAYVA